jgi:hypothetical protein
MNKLGAVWKEMKIVIEQQLYNLGTLLKEAKGKHKLKDI